MLTPLKARLDALLVDIDHFDAEYEAEQLAAIDTALTNFRNAPPRLLDEATGHLWSYYRDSFDEYGPELSVEHGVPVLNDSIDIWTQVSITSPPSVELGRAPYSPAPAYLSFEGEVTWEEEHGLQLVFDNGQRVCKVGPYDGHPTIAHAYADLSLLDEIYR